MPEDIITIDGPSASGKSTLAKKLASKLGVSYLDSGAIYRTIAAFLIQNEFDPKTVDEWKEILQEGTLKLVYSETHVQYFFHGLETTSMLRTDEVALRSSAIAKELPVRLFVNQTLREVAAKGSFVADGRDLGTKVFPNAKIKFFITASVEARAKRRELELTSLGVKTTYEKVYEQLLFRDEQDSKRALDPLRPASDAIFIDTTTLLTDQVCEKMLLVIKKKCGIQPTWYQRAVCSFLKSFFRCFYRLEILGEPFSKQIFGGVVYANHTSYWDALLLLAVLGPRIAFVAHERVIQKNVLFRLLCPLFTLIRVDEKNMPHDFFSTCHRYMKGGISVVIFPEGKRSDGDALLPFQAGLASIIHICRAQQVLPVYLGGVYNVWPKERLFPRFFQKIVVVISKAIQISRFGQTFSKEIKHRLTEQLQGRLKELETYYKDIYEHKS